MRVQIEEYEKKEKETSLESEVLILRQRCNDVETVLERELIEMQELKEQVHENEILLEEKEKIELQFFINNNHKSHHGYGEETEGRNRRMYHISE